MPSIGGFDPAVVWIPKNPSSFSRNARTRPPPPLVVIVLWATKSVDSPSGFRLNCWALDEVSTTPMIEAVPSETLAALAGLTARGSDASATAAVPAMERLRRLERGTTRDENQGK